MITGLEKIWKFVVRFDSSNKKYIAILGYLGNDRKINIPKSIYVNYEDINVTTIEDNAFADCTDLTSITIPSGVTTIGKWAFLNCSSLASITIPASVTTIGDYAFASCSSLASITIPASVTTIGDGAFSGCYSLASITIPYGVTTIGYSAFAYCSSITSIIVPASVTSIGSSAFFKVVTMYITITLTYLQPGKITGKIISKEISTLNLPQCQYQTQTIQILMVIGIM